MERHGEKTIIYKARREVLEEINSVDTFGVGHLISCIVRKHIFIV